MDLDGPPVSADASDTAALPATRLDALFLAQAAKHPDRLALVDDPRRETWNGSPPLELTYSEAVRYVQALVGALQRSGIMPGSIIAMNAPVTAETVLFMLATWRAGLILAPIPPLWGMHECLSYLPQLKPAAFLTAGTDDGKPAARMLREMANGLSTVRHIFAIGGNLPPFVHDVAALMKDAWLDRATVDAEDPVATISMTEPCPAGVPKLHVRRHSHWRAAGTMALNDTGRTDGDGVLLPFSLGGFVGLGAGLAGWLLTAGTLHLHRFLSFDGLLDHVRVADPDSVILPGAFAEAALARLAATGMKLPRITAVWRDRHPDSSHRPMRTAASIVDLTTIDELALVAQRRPRIGGPIGLPLGTVRAGGQALVDIRVDGGAHKAGDRSRPLIGGTIAVAGPMVPGTADFTLTDGENVRTGLAGGEDGFLRTGVTCRIVDGTPPRAITFGRDRDHVVVHGMPVAVAGLDALYASHEGVADAAAVAVPRGANGRQLEAVIVAKPGISVSYEDFRRFLEEKSVAAHHIPVALAAVEMIPRAASGAIMRDVLEDRMRRR